MFTFRFAKLSWQRWFKPHSEVTDSGRNTDAWGKRSLSSAATGGVLRRSAWKKKGRRPRRTLESEENMRKDLFKCDFVCLYFPTVSWRREYNFHKALWKFNNVLWNPASRVAISPLFKQWALVPLSTRYLGTLYCSAKSTGSGVKIWSFIVKISN